jgi:serine protease Do
VKGASGKDFPTLGFADSDQLEVGDLVLAIGNPFGVGQTVTNGIVSALGRTGIESSDYESFIQTDAPINPGNSGGALVNLQGQLVGINTAIFSKSGGSVGIGFAIPSNMVKAVAVAAEQGHKIVRPWLGAQLQDMTSDLANGLSMSVPRGALIADVAQNSPAAQAGLKSGDVVTAINGVAVDSPQGLNYHLATAQLGSTATLTYLRGGSQHQASIKLEAPPAGSGASVAISGNTRFAGATAADLTPAVAQDMSLPFNAKGVVITDVQQGSPADDMGLQAGDVVMNINGTAITDANQFKDMVSHRARGWELTIQREGQVIRSFVSG